MKNFETVIRETKDVPIVLLNPEMDDGTIAGLISRFKFVNHRGPIHKIEVKISEIILTINVRGCVLDTVTKQPVEVIISNGTSYYCHDPVRALGEALRHSIQNFMFHEIDEGLMRDNEFLVDPHPQQRKESVAA